MDNELEKFKINPYKKSHGIRILKDSFTLLKNVYDKKTKLERKYIKLSQKGGKDKTKLETELTEISTFHEKLKELSFFNSDIIDVFSNNPKHLNQFNLFSDSDSDLSSLF
jgi:uncharacterized protein YegJ (DUF2314 family)